MARAAKITYIDEIIKTGKSPEKSSPSPQHYLKEQAYDKTQALRTVGCQKLLSPRITFADEQQLMGELTPAPNSYKAIDTVSDYQKRLILNRTYFFTEPLQLKS